MSVHVLLNLLNVLGNKIRCKGLSNIVSVFPNDFNKFIIEHECKILFTI